MPGEPINVEAVSGKLVELSLAGAPVHSYNRQFLRLVLDATNALACTLWLVRENELVLCEEIEEAVGAVGRIRLSDQQQQAGLRGAFEGGKVGVLKDAPDGFDPLADQPAQQRTIAFVPICGMRGNLGVMRTILPPAQPELVARQIQLTEAFCGYYSLYSAQRALTVQNEERQSIDRLSKAVLQLQHYSFSHQLPDVIVNSALEVVGLDRAILLSFPKSGELEIAAVSSVSQVKEESAWARLLCEMCEIVIQTGRPLHFIPDAMKTEDIGNEELARQVHSYVLMTEARTLIIYPLATGEEKSGCLVFESFSEARLTAFDGVLCTIYSAHSASALANARRLSRVPFSGLFARRLDREDQEGQQPRPTHRLRRALIWLAVAACTNRGPSAHSTETTSVGCL